MKKIFSFVFGIEGPEAGGSDIEEKIENFKEMIGRVKQTFPNASVFATTLREVVHTNKHLWGAIMLNGEEWFVVKPREINVLDRIGGGDGFVGGMLYAALKNWDAEKWIQFGWASGALAATFLTDYGQPADEDMVWSIWKGNARVKRWEKRRKAMLIGISSNLLEQKTAAGVSTINRPYWIIPIERKLSVRKSLQLLQLSNLGKCCRDT